MVDVIDFERINIALFEYKVKISNVTLAYYEHAWSKRGLLCNLAQVQIPEKRNECVLNRWAHGQWHHVIKHNH